MKFFELITEIIGWCKIAISPILIGPILGAIIYFNKQDTVGFILGLIPAVAGLVIGIIWATRVFKSKSGTMHFLSRVDATPELDDMDPK